MPQDLTYLVFSEGMNFLRTNRLLEASNAFRRATREDSGNPLYLSYFGLVQALHLDNMQEAIAICRTAIQRAPYEPELYLNLSKVYVKDGQRQHAFKVLQEGLAFDQDSQVLRMALKRLDLRRRPVFQFLSRTHPLNIKLGKIVHRLRSRTPSATPRAST